MSTFSRLKNLAKGLSLTYGAGADPEEEAALEAELARSAPRPARKAARAAPAPEPEPAPMQAAPEAESRGPVELDEHGVAKRTL